MSQTFIIIAGLYSGIRANFLLSHAYIIVLLHTAFLTDDIHAHCLNDREPSSAFSSFPIHLLLHSTEPRSASSTVTQHLHLN